MSPYTKEDFAHDWEEMCRMSASEKPDDIHELVQWEMARTHKSLIEYWGQVEKNFDTDAPLTDASTYFGFAKQWVRMVEIHHQLEEDVQFPIWDAHLPEQVSKNKAEHRELIAALTPFKEYLHSVDSGSATWDAEKARSLSQAFIPVLMHHFVEELYTIDAKILHEKGVSAETLKQSFAGVAKRGREVMDPVTDIPSFMAHNSGSSVWPQNVVPKDVLDKYPAIYAVHEGWWKYSAHPLSSK
ncbi:hypothetical protein K435DRAFT_688587 [Dendrothele bispora CBS 962.96]|uniref:Hemerythrin-like domain-containing protein n=1 Tax=Dendrothele bispora (strain CBS 962.96) TaxID=1314807 RepID=A0A4S8L6C7_DENBC|nr:hypothetical protein K435DRAFT_688587 [Dendrothele bispora CBS 962.96]